MFAFIYAKFFSEIKVKEKSRCQQVKTSYYINDLMNKTHLSLRYTYIIKQYYAKENTEEK